MNKLQLRNFGLLLCSWAIYYYFCSFFIIALFYLCFCTYLCTLALGFTQTKSERRIIFLSSLLFTIVPLAYYRYFLAFSSPSTLAISADYYFGLGFKGFENLVVPLGLAYQTYQAVGYLIDVFMQRVEATKSPIECALFISFFPQLPLGPISKYSELAPQFKKEKLFDYTLAVDGVALVVYGLAKKIIVSDELHPLYKELFNHKYDFKSSLTIYMLTPIFLYFDFSSFIDIARGISKIFGINLTKNFQSPLTQKTVGDFWSKWHISLFRWLRDYIYYPLLGVSTNKYLVYLWILIIFVMSGIWHGLEAKFAIVGTIAALFYLFEKVVGKFLSKKTKNYPSYLISTLLHIYTYCAIIVITFNYISPSIKTSINLTEFLFKNQNFGVNIFSVHDNNKLFISIVISLIFIALERHIDFFQTKIWTIKYKIKWILIISLSLVILAFYKTNLKPFIYFFS